MSPGIEFVSGSDMEWGAVAQLLEHVTDDREVTVSNPTGTAWKLWWNFPFKYTSANIFWKRH